MVWSAARGSKGPGYDLRFITTIFLATFSLITATVLKIVHFLTNFAYLAVPVYTWGEFIKLGEGDANLDKEVETRLATQRPGHCCTLIYTSGTTGDPKVFDHQQHGITISVFFFLLTKKVDEAYSIKELERIKCFSYFCVVF